ncbi:MAG: maleylacetate reductase [Rhodococcus sp. (in: high G+C Gram-positive bacteria)]|nr:MAG: maleylacetate reductase [Rhodococcus sp. (in: high G+C Gram-positive bacteria)]
MNSFIHTSRATRVVFGEGTVTGLRAEVARLGLRRVHLLASRRIDESIIAPLDGVVVARTADLVQHVPIEQVDKGAHRNSSAEVDGYVAIGGGSSIGLAKAFALRLRAPILAVPTTFSGSEMSPIWGITDAGVKTTGRDEAVAPTTVIYDPQLTTGLPSTLAVTSSVNAMAHAVEALYADDGSPIVSLMAEEAIRLLGDALPGLGSDGDVSARSDALQGAWLAGVCLGSVTMALHHKICHTLGGSFGLPHADTHTVMLPYAIGYNAHATPEAQRAICRALRVSNAAHGVQDLVRSCGGPTNLRALGFREEDIDWAVELATQQPYPNPCPITAEGIRALLGAALNDELDRL